VISKLNQAPPRIEASFAGDVKGQRLAHFELDEPIGVGGMAAVIRARDLQLDRFVALKILPRDMASNPEPVRRFQQEARAAAKLDHENIARVFYCGEDQGIHFIAFEFVEGENLKALMDRRGPLPAPEAIGYMLQVALGLAHASARGVVHRDIKPSNIIISPNGRAKLVDMGLARSLETRQDGGLTHSGVTLGTFDYISPEQALEPREADVCSDIYSLGCTFYHVLTGQAPVPDGTVAKKLYHHQHVDPADPRQLNPKISDDMAGLLSRMMAKERSQRYQRPEELIRHLYLLARKFGAIAETDRALLLDSPLPRPPKMRPLALVITAAAAMVAFVLLLTPSSMSVNSETLPGKTPESYEPVKASAPTQIPPSVTEDPAGQDGRTIRIVDPKALNPKFNSYRTVRQALEEATPGDEIQIKHTGLLRIDPVQIDKAGLDVAIKPYPGYHPILTCGQANDPEAALFHLRKGHLRLHGLEFRLAPDRERFGAQTVVALAKEGQCVLKDCVATLEENRYAALSVATVADSSQVSSPNSQGTAGHDPRLTFHNCFVRGMGNLVAVRAGRPLQMRVEQSLVALDGSLLTMDPSRRDTADGLHAEIALQKVTTYLTDSLLAMRAFGDLTRSTKGPVSTQIKSAVDCLFVSAEGKPLIHLEGIDNEEQMRNHFSWEDGRRNIYSNFAQLLELQPARQDRSPPAAYGQTQWEEFSHEADSRFEPVRFPLPGEVQLSHVNQLSFKPESSIGLGECGADVERLPRPRDQGCSPAHPSSGSP